MSPNDLKPSDIAAWYRQQIKKYQRLLELHEAEFPSVSAPVPSRAPKPAPVAEVAGGVTADRIKAYISKRGARAAELANHFGVKVEEIKAIIANPASGLSDQDRGWVKELQQLNMFK